MVGIRRSDGAFALAWKGGNTIGMTGSTGGRGVMIFTLEDEFRQIFLDGRLIIGAGSTQRFDIRTTSPGALRLGIAGWFAHTA